MDEATHAVEVFSEAEAQEVKVYHCCDERVSHWR